MSANIDNKVVEGFGDEWKRFDQTGLDAVELQRLFDSYFHIFPWHRLAVPASGFDLGCGSGRWAKLVAPRVGQLHCIDASSVALDVARSNLRDAANCQFHNAAVDQIPLADGSQDFGYSLGVLHHIPDTAAALQACTRKLKPGAPFLVYLYYRFDNRPVWFRAIWRASEVVRSLVSRMPHQLRYVASQLIAFLIYLPVSRAARLFEATGVDVSHFPLAFYRNKSLYVLRTDALDRFGTRLEQRFTRQEIIGMMSDAGLGEIVVSDTPPYWCAVGMKLATSA